MGGVTTLESKERCRCQREENLRWPPMSYMAKSVP